MARTKKAAPAVPRLEEGTGAAAVWTPLAKLHRWKDNPRKNDDAVDEIAESIRTFGAGAPILARKANGEIIAGDTRYQAAKRLGMKRFPVRFLDLSEEEAHALALADNKLGEVAEWDDAKLSAVLRRLREQQVPTAGLGFSDLELRYLLEGPSFGPGKPDAQGRLDVKVEIECPHCGKKFARK